MVRGGEDRICTILGFALSSRVHRAADTQQSHQDDAVSVALVPHGQVTPRRVYLIVSTD
jgi:hypothetical protein